MIDLRQDSQMLRKTLHEDSVRLRKHTKAFLCRPSSAREPLTSPQLSPA